MGTFGKEPEAAYVKVPFRLEVAETDLQRSFPALPFVPGDAEKRRRRCEEILSIQSYGLKKRYEHTGAKTAVLGISGGLDSALALTCREKAKAVFNGKAEVTMCLPYMRARAESLSDKILGSTPNAILVVGEDLTVQQMNGAAARFFGLERPDAAVHKPVEDFLDPVDFIFVLEDGRPIKDRKIWLEKSEKFVEETIVYDIENKLLLAIMKDVTAEEKENRRAQELRQQTLEVTDRIIQKQMRTVQEIASLLGETTAETKVALTKLRGAVAEGQSHE